MKLRITSSADSATLVFAGELDLYTVERARDALLEPLAVTTALELDLRAVTACDLAGLQLLISVHRSATAAGKPFTLTQPVPVLATAADHLGLPDLPWLSATR